jgi:hypothetical protein
MNHTQQSTRNSNFGQFRNDWCTLTRRGAWLCNASPNRTNYGLPKKCDVGPQEIIDRIQKGCALDKRIHYNDVIKMLRFANQTYNSRWL